MSAEILRRAASLMRERAEAATPGPWHIECAHHGGGDDQIHLVLDVMRDRYGTNCVPTDDHGTATHIASWHPTVALAVADWLDHEADAFDQHRVPITTRDLRVTPALAVAHAYLGGVA